MIPSESPSVLVIGWVMTKFGVVGLMVVGVALACHQLPANAQTDVARSDEAANQGSPAERKVRVVLPSPYKQTDIKPAKTVQPAASTPPAIRPVAATPPPTAKPVIPVAGSPNAKAPTPGQSVQASTNAAPATAPQAGNALRRPSRQVSAPVERQVNAPSEDQPTGGHDLNLASLDELNRLGGGMIGRAIIAGRPYHSSDELVTRRILSRATYALIRAQVSVRSSARY